MKKKIACIASDKWACFKFRIGEPYENLKSDEFEFDVWMPEKLAGKTGEQIFNELKNYHCVVFQRPAHRVIANLIYNLKRIGVKTVVEIDDDLFNVSHLSPAYKTWNPESEQTKAYRWCLEQVDAITCSTPELAESLSGYCANTQVFYNAINFDDPVYSPENSKRNELPLDKTVTLWTGSSTHYDSILQIRDSFREIFLRRKDSIFALCSNKEFLDKFKIRPNQKHYIPHVPIDQYAAIPSMGDIGITPVVPNQFNACKSELKILEYGVWGVPSVSTDSAPYRRFHEISDGANFLVKDNSPKQWMTALHTLMDDVDLRRKMGHNTLETIKTYYDLKVINKKRLAFFKDLLL